MRDAQAFVSVNWVLTEEPLDLPTELGMDFLDFLLVGTSASPLRRALMDSGLGEAIIGGGLQGDLRQPVFSIGLKGVDPANFAKARAPPRRLHVCSVLEHADSELSQKLQ